jgi:hypothetical protein
MCNIVNLGSQTCGSDLGSASVAFARWNVHEMFLFLGEESTDHSGLNISQGTEANGRGALSDWHCALKNSFHIFHLPRPYPAEWP